MKLLYEIVFFVFLVFSSTFCPSKQTRKEIVVAVDFQEGFDNEIVELRYKQEVIYKDTITTDDVIGLASSVELSISKDRDLISLNIRDKKYLIECIGFTPYLGITFIPKYDTIRISYSNHPFFYD